MLAWLDLCMQKFIEFSKFNLNRIKIGHGLITYSRR